MFFLIESGTPPKNSYCTVLNFLGALLRICLQNHLPCLVWSDIWMYVILVSMHILLGTALLYWWIIPNYLRVTFFPKQNENLEHLLTPCWSLLEFSRIKFEKSISTNWIFSLQKSILKLIFAGTSSKNQVWNRLKSILSNLIFQK
jgi:hypothetical protein